MKTKIYTITGYKVITSGSSHGLASLVRDALMEEAGWEYLGGVSVSQDERSYCYAQALVRPKDVLNNGMFPRKYDTDGNQIPWVDEGGGVFS